MALFLSRGTPYTEAMIPVLDEFKVLLIGPSTGAAFLQTPTLKYVFNVRASYRRNAKDAVDLLASHCRKTPPAASPKHWVNMPRAPL